MFLNVNANALLYLILNTYTMTLLKVFPQENIQHQQNEMNG